MGKLFNKLLACTLLLFFTISVFGQIYKNKVVDSDYSYAGKFNQYSSFGFVKNKDFNGIIRYLCIPLQDR